MVPNILLNISQWLVASQVSSLYNELCNPFDCVIVPSHRIVRIVDTLVFLVMVYRRRCARFMIYYILGGYRQNRLAGHGAVFQKGTVAPYSDKHDGKSPLKRHRIELMDRDEG